MRICTLQPEIHPGDTEGNLSSIRGMLEAAAGKNSPDLTVLPENFPFWGSRLGKSGDYQSVLDFLSRLAKDFSMNLIGGSLHHIDPDSGDYHNTCHVFNRGGETVGIYRKRKLFDREIKFGVVPGTEPAVFNLEGWRVAVQICADLWYPELARGIQGEFDILAVPAQSVVRNEDYQEYGRKLWHNLALTRAQENAVVTIVADHPALPRKPYCSGGFSICDPSVSVESADMEAIQLRDDDGAPGMLTTTIDRERLRQFRRYRIERGMLPVSK